jgi:hypothetical protein
MQQIMNRASLQKLDEIYHQLELGPTTKSAPQEHHMIESMTDATSPHNITQRKLMQFNPLVVTTVEPSATCNIPSIIPSLIYVQCRYKFWLRPNDVYAKCISKFLIIKCDASW